MIPSEATPPLLQMILTAAEMSFVWFWAGFHSFLYGGGPELALLIVFITRGSSAFAHCTTLWPPAGISAAE